MELLYFCILEFKVSVDFIRGSCRSKTPLHLTSGSVGSDLFSTKNYVSLPTQTLLIECGLHMEIPNGYLGLISGRSSLTFQGINTHVGITDNEYAGSMGVILTNMSCYPEYRINRGDRIAQITLINCSRVLWNEVKDFEMKNYGKTLRMGGFGSTGV